MPKMRDVQKTSLCLYTAQFGGWHAASFECKSGKLAKFPAKIEDLKSYKVTVENGDVFVEV